MSRRPISEVPLTGTNVRLFLYRGGYVNVRVYTDPKDIGRLIAKSVGTRVEHTWADLDKKIKWEYL